MKSIHLAFPAGVGASLPPRALIQQLEFDGFTQEQAVYGVDQNGY
ncbi:Ltp family lipoprotein [Pseudoflavonifractor phocaeensis]